MHRRWYIFLIIFGILLFPKTAYADNPVVWKGEIEGISTWITIVPRGHEISTLTMEVEPWWNWGNADTDAYIFAFKEPENVQVIISFDQDENGQPAAKIYKAEGEGNPIQYQLHEGELSIQSNNGYPYITVHPRDGGWLVNGAANYNLDLLFDGSGSGGIGDGGAPTDGIVDARLTVRGKNPGVPDWEVIKLEYDPKPMDGYTRLGAALRMEEAPPFQVAEPILPGFPYFGIGGTSSYRFLQNPNPLFFSLHNMALELYSFTGFQIGGMFQINSLTNPPHVSFESPFNFYNFDPKTRQAHLVIRGFYSAANDPRDTVLPLPRLSVRYSWKTEDEQSWHYGLQLSDFHTYQDRIMIGDTEIYSVEPEKFPEWVTNKTWRAVTFIEATDGYPGSEGIYFYSGIEFEDWNWLAGRTKVGGNFFKEPLLQETSALTKVGGRTLPAGFRGEYSLAHSDPPKLYFSRMDNKLHLLGAEGGIWYLGEGILLRTADHDQDGVVDSWVREEAPPDLHENDLRRASPGQVIESIIDANGILFHSKSGRLEIIQSSRERVAFTITPPTDKETWDVFRTLVHPFTAHEKDPRDLKSWLDVHPGPRTTIHGASLANLRFITGGFRFELSLEAGYRLGGPDLLGLAGLHPGKYLVEKLGGVFTVTPLTPAKIHLNFHRPTGENATSAWITLHNSGQADRPDLELVKEVIGGDSRVIELSRQAVVLLGEQTFNLPVELPPSLLEDMSLRFRVEDSDSQTLAQEIIIDRIETNSYELISRPMALSTAAGRRVSWLVILALFAYLPLAALSRHYSPNDPS
jgi:hypothetical protein